MYQLGLFGYEIEYSLSPLIHHYWFSMYGIQGNYQLFDTNPAEKDLFWEKLANGSFHGLNVTIPYKEFAYQKFTKISPRLTAINTIYKDKTGNYAGANTDVAGGLDLFQDYRQGEKIVILGNGGTARALVEIFYLLKAKEIHLLERQSKTWHPDYKLQFHALEESELVIPSAKILINTIPDFSGALNNLHSDTLVCDYTYHKKNNQFIAAAIEKGCQTVTGVEFLLRQAQHSFKYWFSIFPEITPELRQKLGQQ